MFAIMDYTELFAIVGGDEKFKVLNENTFCLQPFLLREYYNHYSLPKKNEKDFEYFIVDKAIFQFKNMEDDKTMIKADFVNHKKERIIYVDDSSKKIWLINNETSFLYVYDSKETN